ncbi:siderophore ABC transporter substrate-binding protein [Arsenicicoccus sp. oral taxon 190]|uniref:siderophore ABC transporter substrate-binding protein n=1 Tax=Arsenicicoccus sp. oral taxon 190 TaxID=1658671 RepID=UPI000679F0E4|nr:siderophore ABC transporter substrate-binding protein [Arsenicicoccus sp. oral taxon 190]AKT51607.1 hypothetical protein ADJ73_10410 [Arsenicicoccus sp. oral taxon 190]
MPTPVPAPARHLTPRTLGGVAVLTAATLATAACGSADASGGSSSGSSGSSGGSSQASGRTVTVTHAKGTTEVPVQPRKVAVLDMGVLDSIRSIGAGDAVSAVTKQAMPTFLQDFSAGRYADLGPMKEPDLEKLATDKPDLIVVGARATAKYPELSKIAPTIDLTISSKGDFVTNAKAANTTLGRIFAKEKEVAAKHAQLDAAVTRARSKASNAGTGLILMTSGGKVSAFGPSSRFGLIHQVLGVKPTAAQISEDRHGQAASFEFVKAANPAHLFVVDRDAAIGESGKAAAQILDNPLVKATPAGANGRITYLDGQRWYVTGAGLDNLAAMVDEAAAGL